MNLRRFPAMLDGFEQLRVHARQMMESLVLPFREDGFFLVILRFLGDGHVGTEDDVTVALGQIACDFLAAFVDGGEPGHVGDRVAIACFGPLVFRRQWIGQPQDTLYLFVRLGEFVQDDEHAFESRIAGGDGDAFFDARLNVLIERSRFLPGARRGGRWGFLPPFAAAGSRCALRDASRGLRGAGFR